MSLLETFLTASPASQGATILFLAMLITGKSDKSMRAGLWLTSLYKEKCGISRHFTRQFEFRYLSAGIGQQEVTR